MHSGSYSGKLCIISRTQLQAMELNPEEYSHEEALIGQNSSRISTPLLNLSNP